MTELFARALARVVATWPLLLIRFAGQLAMLAVVAVGIVVSIIPTAIAGVASIRKFFEDPSAGNWEELVLQNLWIIGWILVAAVLTALVMLAIHLFVQAGTIAVYVTPRPGRPPTTTPFGEVPVEFDASLFFQGARRFIVRLFLIYNALWGFAAVALLVPLAATILLMIAAGDQKQTLVAGCAGLGATFLFALPVLFIAGSWTQYASIAAVLDDLTTARAISRGWDLFRIHIGETLFIVIAIIAASVLSSVIFLPLAGIPYAGGDYPGIIIVPLAFAGSLLQAFVTIVLTNIALALFVEVTLSSSRGTETHAPTRF